MGLGKERIDTLMEVLGTARGLCQLEKSAEHVLGYVELALMDMLEATSADYDPDRFTRGVECEAVSYYAAVSKILKAGGMELHDCKSPPRKAGSRRSIRPKIV